MLDLALASGGLLDGLGINLKVVAVQVAVFSATFLILSKTLFGRAMENIARREGEMEKLREEAARDRAEGDRLSAGVEDRLKKADKESYERTQALMTDALARSAGRVAEAQASAKASLDQAKAEISREKQAALDGLRSQVGRLALEAAEKALDERLDPARHGALAEQFLSGRNLT